MEEIGISLLGLSVIAALVGILVPYKGLTRRQFGGILLGLLIASPFVVQPHTPEQIAAAEATEAKSKAAEIARQNTDIATKAKSALASTINYTRADNPKTLKLVGASAFRTLDKLEPGAILAVAESNRCDSVETGAISLSKSSREVPIWFVDCENGNRFLIGKDVARAALARSEAGILALSELAESCTKTSLSMCDASSEQRTANETEIVSFCDLTVKEALVGDSSMDWSWNYTFGRGDDIEVVRGFKAENAFGAKLKHRYLCLYDAGSKRIKRLTVEGPFGTQRVI